jgi:hypothetical protein
MTMNFEIYNNVKRLNELFCEVEKSIREQQKELELTRLERDIYKSIIINSQNVSNLKRGTNIVHVVIYSRDNGEGSDTETCIGVFTSKTNAMKAVLDVCKSNAELSVDGFMINELNIDKDLQSGDNVYVIHCDEEAHCEISTTVLDVKCDNKINDYKDCYSIEYTVDKVHYIE